MTFDIFTTDWSSARKKLDGWKPAERAVDIFAGEAHFQGAEIEGVAVTRLLVRPQSQSGAAKVSKSFAVCYEAAWHNQSIEQNQPFGLTWLQAKPGRFDFYFDMPEHIGCLGLGERFSDLNLRGSKSKLCCKKFGKFRKFSS